MPKTVLIVEDVPLERKLLVAAIKKSGYAAIGVGRGKQAISHVLETPDGVGVVLLDMRLPDISGLDVFRAVRHGAPTIPIVLCPGLADSQETRTALAEGADGCLPKPLDFAQVVAVVRSHIGPP
jgi:DNA-binding response OmpR family regulator